MGWMADYWAMGGYAAYIWPAYGVATVILAGMFLVSLASVRQREALLRVLEDSRVMRRRNPRCSETASMVDPNEEPAP